MSIEILNQRDYLLTEVAIKPPCDIHKIDEIMRLSRGNGRITALYSDGVVTGVNIEQKTKVRENVVDQVREMVGVVDAEVNGHHG